MLFTTITTIADLDALLTTAGESPETLTDDQVQDLVELVDTVALVLPPAVRVWASLLTRAVVDADRLLKSLPPIVLQIVLRPNEAIAQALAASDAAASSTSSLPAPTDPTPAPEPTTTPDPAPAPYFTPATAQTGTDGADDAAPVESLANRPSA